jgi:hypothetical protein
VPVAGLALHQQSNTYRDRLWSGGSDRPGNINLMFEGYTYPVYMASAATGLFPVEVEYRSNLNGQTMPWNPSGRGATGSDGQVIMLDPATGREWDLWQVEFDGTTVRATNGNLVPGSYWTREIGFPPSRGAGIPYLAMLVRPAEVEQGVIPHALSMPIRNPDGASYVAPATKLERRTEVVGVPEGMRFALRIDDVEIDRWVADLPPELPPHPPCGCGDRPGASRLRLVHHRYDGQCPPAARGPHHRRQGLGSPRPGRSRGRRP